MNAARRTMGNQPTVDKASEKERLLRRLMREMRGVLVAYSGGVDSAYLALIATQELGPQALCVMGLSPSVSASQRRQAETVADRHGFHFRMLATNEVNNPEYRANPTNRCYFCKSELYAKLNALALESAVDVIIDGTNADDLRDHRPGRVAASENGVRSPLAEIGFSKDDIRECSRMHGLSTWDQPSSPCLSSRIAYGIPVTIERLGKIERAEEILRSEGFREFRVRVHGELARVEIAKDEMERALDLELALRIAGELKELGFKYATLDLEGFRSGAMNDAAGYDKTS